MPVEDAVLIRRTINLDDHHAYEQLVRRYQSCVRGSLRCICNGDLSLADDLAQETFIKAYYALKTFKGTSKFSVWLYRISYNLAMSHYRKKHPISYSEIESEHREETVRSGIPRNLDIDRDVNTALSKLGVEQRTAIYLCLNQGFSHTEAAEIMNIPLGTLKTHILRAKEKLVISLSDWCETVES